MRGLLPIARRGRKIVTAVLGRTPFPAGKGGDASTLPGSRRRRSLRRHRGRGECGALRMHGQENTADGQPPALPSPERTCTRESPYWSGCGPGWLHRPGKRTSGRGGGERQTSRAVRRVLFPGFLAEPGATAIHLGPTLPPASCSPPADIGRAALKRPRRDTGVSPLDLAPGGVYLAAQVTLGTGGLLHHRFTLTGSRSPRRSAFCGTVPRVTPGGC
jgi:hypothetical protein